MKKNTILTDRQTDRQTDRHAYLILCHTNFNQLNKLLILLDNERNDIYLHIDIKSKDYSIPQIKSYIHKAHLFFIKPISIKWGGYSQIKAEICLLTESIKVKHEYYHLISGMDLPLKTQNEILAFFDSKPKVDYVSMEKDQPYNINKEFMNRVNYYYFFQNIIGRKRNWFYNKLFRLEKTSIALQRKLNICRTKNKRIVFCKGSNWFSITHKTAQYVVENFKLYKQLFKYSYCADELFLQTILINSSFADSIIDDGLRLIDWKRGTPYTFRADDFEMLIHSDENRLFARKFDERIDKVIIDKIYQHLKTKSELR